jgi:hypothetical protein
MGEGVRDCTVLDDMGGEWEHKRLSHGLDERLEEVITAVEKE